MAEATKLSPLSAEQILALAPDASSAKSGRELANPRKWVTLGHNERVAWGECQGSGSKPYQTQIDLNETGFNCSCPSRKFPCKHGLGLFLILAENPAAFPAAGDPPAWVEKWIEGRANRAKKAVEREETKTDEEREKEKKTREAAAAKRLDKREERINAGLSEVADWMRDMIRGGLAATQGQKHAYWDRPAARMIDAQAPGIARLIRQMEGTPQSGEGWAERLLEQLAALHLAVEGYSRIDTLPAETQADLRTLVGWTQSQDELLEQEGERGKVMVVGQVTEEDEKVKNRRSWLMRENGEIALVLHFAAGNQPLDSSLVPGTAFDATLVYFPGSVKQRALVKERHSAVSNMPNPNGQSIAEAIAAYGRALSRNPWIERYPVLLNGVVPVHSGDTWAVQDAENKILEIGANFDEGWKLLAISGGNPLTIFGEWNGKRLRPMSAWTDHFVLL